MTTSQPIAGPEAPAREAPRPEHPIRPTGDQAELNALARASQERRLTDDERLRLAALTWAPDEQMERSRLVRDRHPDIYAQVPTNWTFGLEKTYEPARAAAIAAGRTVSEPSPEIVAEVDEHAELWRATLEEGKGLDPPKVLDRRHRAAFAAAVREGHEAMIAAWDAWLADIRARNALSARRAAATSYFGRAAGFGESQPPRFLVELERAIGGGSSIVSSSSSPIDPGINVPGASRFDRAG